MAVAACASAQQQQVRQQARAATAFLEREGSVGDPGRVAAADFAFARMAREDGNWTAFRAYAAPGALLDDDADPAGWSTVLGQLQGRADPAEAVAWGPTRVWSSCDGRVAVSEGRSRRPTGVVGTYITVWELQPDNQYRFIYDTGTPDDPQPAPEPVEELPDGAILVPGMTALQGSVADCPRQGEAIPTPSPEPTATGTRSGGGASPDGTLRWQRIVNPDGSRRVAVWWLRDGTWQLATELLVPVQG
ncbi:hypothetical protein GRI62_00560 [Erythrobacter arachoides]|uniref:Uncharacterized protein n=1 Tax=Aurantiacibacter arachoides TaxID=1850444 RepID=A0A844ZZD7_9SPHN|nr:hypothetical protein [Aurantiacibacter arachoides]MXO92097.1 hypothetical protein [Aurantiacibacter arachoides]GGD59735.1 hypothetical protein GCM10011411_19930 [Aurantiacibacter arachoides]